MGRPRKYFNEEDRKAAIASKARDRYHLCREDVCAYRRRIYKKTHHPQEPRHQTPIERKNAVKSKEHKSSTSTDKKDKLKRKKAAEGRIARGKTKKQIEKQAAKSREDRVGDGRQRYRDTLAREIATKKRDVESALCFLSPTLFAVKTAKLYDAGNTEAFKAAYETLNALWDSITPWQESLVRMCGAAEEVGESEELQCTIAETMGELDALENCKIPLRDAIVQLELANGCVVAV